MKKKKYMVAGEYDHYQLGGYFTVKQYIMTVREEKLCLLLRFENQMNTRVEAAEFVVKQLDSEGKLLGNIRIHYSDLRVEPGQLYCPDKGIVLHDDCTDFVIQMKYVISERTKYSFRNGVATAHYDIRGYEKKKSGTSHKSRVTIRRKFDGRLKCFGWIAVVSLILTAVIFLALIGLLKTKYRDKSYLSDGKETQITISRSSAC